MIERAELAPVKPNIARIDTDSTRSSHLPKTPSSAVSDQIDHTEPAEVKEQPLAPQSTAGTKRAVVALGELPRVQAQVERASANTRKLFRHNSSASRNGDAGLTSTEPLASRMMRGAGAQLRGCLTASPETTQSDTSEPTAGSGGASAAWAHSLAAAMTDMQQQLQALAQSVKDMQLRFEQHVQSTEMRLRLIERRAGAALPAVAPPSSKHLAVE